jgi:hypothetical protein
MAEALVVHDSVFVDQAANPVWSTIVSEILRAIAATNSSVHLRTTSPSTQADWASLMVQFLRGDPTIYVPLIDSAYLHSIEHFFRYVESRNTSVVFPVLIATATDPRRLAKIQVDWLKDIHSRRRVLHVKEFSEEYFKTSEFRGRVQEFSYAASRSITEAISRSSGRWSATSRQRPNTKNASSFLTGLTKFFSPDAKNVIAEIDATSQIHADAQALTHTQKSILRILYLYVLDREISLDELYSKFVDAYGDKSVRSRGELFYRLQSLASLGLVQLSLSAGRTIIKKAVPFRDRFRHASLRNLDS